MDNTLQIELAFFEAHRQEWLETNRNRYALVSGEQLLGFFAEWIKAFEHGCAHVGVQRAFLVKQVLERDEVFYIFACMTDQTAPRQQRHNQTTFGQLAGGQRSGI